MKRDFIRWAAITASAAVLGAWLVACGSGPVNYEARARLAKAEEMFAQRCKKSGEFIHRTVENVEGVYLLKVRPNTVNYGHSIEGQYSLDDPYGEDSTGETYIKTFFSDFYPPPVQPVAEWKPKLGYAFIEADDPSDRQRYRYTGSIREYEARSSFLVGGDGRTFKTTGFVLDKVPAPGLAPRYGVTYDDISTRDERDYWIAGSSLKVIDLQTGEVIAERVGYMMDRGQGSKSGGRAPWLLAARTACPAFPASPGGHPVQADQTRRFVLKAVQPKQGK
jgi:hypothetical protein